MELSKRLQAVADLVTPGLVVADIGTDHGYIPLYLLNSGKNPQAIAMDVRKGPLARAEEHLSALLEHGKVQIRLSDGMKELKHYFHIRLIRRLWIMQIRMLYLCTVFQLSMI